MDTTPIARSLRAAAPVRAKAAAPTQGQLLKELLGAMAAAVPASGTRKLTPTEIGEALKLVGEDLQRFLPLVVEASITSTGAVTLLLNDEFRFRPVPEARELLIRQVLRATVSKGKLDIEEGLAAIVVFVKPRIERIQEATEEGVPGVLVVANLGSEFYPIKES